ncbi:hypothetical protein Cme02nite_19590 [Catellatospora methionotrophica]|uniref:Uncharacterized protein n=1 Tax=Catellatospora methionotrophica TaxID=121620 RepID=A0A8J3L7F2_9ACTN|nr:hypothetical protein [Catellatospora methionotrophica]GIG13627.1 hypothetical protein Cme02nite_19590 [Catellatospora methionotrophica]
MTTEPQPPVDDTVAEPAPEPRPTRPARAWRRPPGGMLAGLLIAFVLGGLVCGGLGLAVGLVAGHHHGNHRFDRDDRDDRGPWGGLRDRDDRPRPQRLRDQDRQQRLQDRLRRHDLDGQPMPWPFPLNPPPGGGMPLPAPTAPAAPASPTVAP